ncbi:serine/threonine protein kinase [Fulvivirga imtechensis AK7]|uniref:Serine/threonine protein kinase n=2 Tax=Fulvivirga TaxID=396811 RepID=L8JM42_9BACT|nr:serine/threonine protein kinase [Fulvivirga imtechensis AK7]
MQKDGSFTGVCVDIMKQFELFVKEKHNVTLKIDPVANHYSNYPEFLKVVKESRGGVFGLNTTTITEKRKGIYEISPPFITNVSMLVSNAAAPALGSLQELPSKFENMIALTVRNSSNESSLLAWKKKYYPAMKIEYVNTNSEVVQRVASEPNKFTNIDFIYYFEALRDGKSIVRHAAGDDTNEKFGIIMPKGSDWAPVMAEFFRSGFMESAECKKILATHLGQSAMKFFESLK